MEGGIHFIGQEKEQNKYEESRKNEIRQKQKLTN